MRLSYQRRPDVPLDLTRVGLAQRPWARVNLVPLRPRDGALAPEQVRPQPPAEVALLVVVAVGPRGALEVHPLHRGARAGLAVVVPRRPGRLAAAVDVV